MNCKFVTHPLNLRAPYFQQIPQVMFQSSRPFKYDYDVWNLGPTAHSLGPASHLPLFQPNLWGGTNSLLNYCWTNPALLCTLYNLMEIFGPSYQPWKRFPGMSAIIFPEIPGEFRKFLENSWRFSGNSWRFSGNFLGRLPATKESSFCLSQSDEPVKSGVWN